MNLQDKLDAKRREFETTAPKEVQAVMRQATEDLVRSGIVARAKGVGDPAPDFALPNQGGDTVTLWGLLSRGPAVVGFYRGRWWPYCNLELEALEAAHETFRQRGATLVMISPQSMEHTRKFTSLKNLTMDVLSDAGSQVAQAFGLVFKVPEELQKLYTQFGIDVATYNADGSWNLPLPARYIIDRRGVIRYAEVNADYTLRPNPEHTLQALEAIDAT